MSPRRGPMTPYLSSPVAPRSTPSSSIFGWSNIARRDQREVHGKGRRRHAVEEHGVMPVGGAAEVLQGEGAKTVAVEGRRHLVVGPGEVLRVEVERSFEPGEVEDAGAGCESPRDHPPRPAKLSDVVLGAADDPAARVRQAGRELVAEGGGAHEEITMRTS